MVARMMWADRRDRAVLHFVDNDAARFALIKGSSPTTDSAWLTSQFWEEEASVGAFSWFERVPSPSNPADGPSRGVPPAAMIGKDGKNIEAKEVDLPLGFEAIVAAKWIPKLDTPKLVADMSGS